MNHYDEHTLELFVLGASKVDNQRQAIEQHLTTCANCRDLVNRMHAFYQDFREELEKHAPEADQAQEKLILASQRLSHHERSESRPAETYRPVTRLQRLQHFARMHPVAVGGGTFLAFAAATLLTLNTQNLFGDRNPATYRFNVPEERVEILNASGDPLWHIFIKNAADEQKLDATGLEMKRVLITDLDGDGKSEVGSILTVGKREPQPGRDLRIYSYDGALKQTIQLDAPIEYLQREYVEAWFALGVEVTAPDSSGRRELIVLWTCNRSPSIIARYDAEGRILGEYWHFGKWHDMKVMDVFIDGKERLLLMGMNDIHDTLHLEFPSIAVLDIEKITGRKKSLTTPGFNLPFSNAEVAYVRLPRSPLAAILNTNEIARRLRLATKDRLAFVVNGADGSYDYEYIFTRSFAITSVKSTTSTDIIYAGLAAQGKAAGKVDSTYLSGLKNGIRYFDGEEWKSEPTRIGGKAILANKELNPSYSLISYELGIAEICNEQGKVLWDIRIPKEHVRPIDGVSKRVNIADLDGDGVSEVISTHPQRPHSASPVPLVVYDYRGSILLNSYVTRNFKYLDRDYSPNFTLSCNTTRLVNATGKREIWVSGVSYGRSPNLVLRLDADGNTLGEYWHFGNLGHIFLHDIDLDGIKEIVLSGLNDVDDEIKSPTGVIIVLDPDKVRGSTKSTIAPGFAFPSSNAEKFVIAIPRCDLADVLKTNPSVHPIEIRQDAVLFSDMNSIRYVGLEHGIDFTYIINNDMSVREVKSATATDRLHRVLAADGKVQGTIDAAYLQRLKEGVRYWDGSEWRKEVTRVRHTPVTAMN